MHKERSQGSVCFLLGPDQDRQDFHSYFEQSGFQVHVFKNPSVLFDYLQEFKPFAVVLDTKALRSKLSSWVSQLHAIRSGQSWLALAPMDQYTILATYQNRGLVEIVATDALYLKERTLWALDREFDKFQLSRKPVATSLDFIENHKPQPVVIDSKGQNEVNLESLLYLRTREAQLRKLPLSFVELSLDDQKEISEFWGPDILSQSHDLLYQMAQEFWGIQNVFKNEGRVSLILNKSAPKVLIDLQNLQNEIQNVGKEKFGFKFSMSGGLAELSVHTHRVQDLLRVSLEGCLKMQSKGGGRVAMPKPLHEDQGGDLSQDMG